MIEKVLDALGAGLKDIDRGAFPGAMIDDALDFLDNFADACHHAKEEVLLFPAMNERGLPREAGPVAVMLSEHSRGRAQLAMIQDHLADAKAGSTGAVAVVRRNLADYIWLLREHIAKEDQVLFQIARNIFSEEDNERLQGKFDEFEAARGRQLHEKYEAVANRLAAAINIVSA